LRHVAIAGANASSAASFIERRTASPGISAKLNHAMTRRMPSSASASSCPTAVSGEPQMPASSESYGISARASMSVGAMQIRRKT
jgi:hypothetical protein